MKYRVIGWTVAGALAYNGRRDTTQSMDNAIIDEIKKCGYRFGGDVQDDYCPVLNDGTYAVYSSREWGAIMAKAYGITGEYAYMNFYMDQSIKPGTHHYPNDYPNSDLIEPIESLSETFDIVLSSEEYDTSKDISSVDISLLETEEQRRVDAGDYIRFVKQGDETQCFTKKVSEVRGYSIVLQEPIHTCRTWVTSYGEEYCSRNLDIQSEMYSSGVFDSEYERTGGMDYTYDLAREVIELIGDAEEDDYELFEYRCVEIGRNETYEQDVNAMIRKTLKHLFGKEEQLKAIRNKYWACISLHVVATVVKDSKEPKQKLELDEDIKQFLEKSEVQLELQVFKV